MQQVNLYVPELRPQRTWLTAKDALTALAAFLLFVLVIQTIWHVRADNLTDELAVHQAQLDEMQVRVDKLIAAAPSASSAPYDRTIADLEAAIEGRIQVRRIISGQNVGNAEGFHGRMLSLAQQSSPELALEWFSFTRGGNYVQMLGRARTAQAIPLYLQRLKQEQPFDQARFGLLSVATGEPGQQGLAFALGYDNLYQADTAGGQP